MTVECLMFCSEYTEIFDNPTRHTLSRLAQYMSDIFQAKFSTFLFFLWPQVVSSDSDEYFCLADNAAGEARAAARLTVHCE